MKSFPPVSNFEFQIVEMEGTPDMTWVRGTHSLTMSPPVRASRLDRTAPTTIADIKGPASAAIARHERPVYARPGLRLAMTHS
jgi:hypothetical protein